MIKFIHKNIKITGISTTVPVKVKKIDDFIGQFGDETVQKFKKMTGVQNIHISQENQTASDLGFSAAKSLIEKKKIEPSSIGALIFITQTPDYKIPSTSCVLQKRLYLSKDCVVFDINLGCSGYIYGLQTLCSIMNSSNIDKALLIAGDTLSKLISPEDRSAVMSLSISPEIIYPILESDEFYSNGGIKHD
jgi:3-oxoacyl-[acyl-carrier-protein] synthase-3